MKSKEVLAVIIDLHERLRQTEALYERVNGFYGQACRRVQELDAENKRLTRELMIARGERPNGSDDA